MVWMWINELLCIIQVVEYVLSISPLPLIQTIYQKRRWVPDQVAFVCVVQSTVVPVRPLWLRKFNDLSLLQFPWSNFIVQLSFKYRNRSDTAWLSRSIHGTRSQWAAHKRVNVQMGRRRRGRGPTTTSDKRQAHTRSTPHSTHYAMHSPQFGRCAPAPFEVRLS